MRQTCICPWCMYVYVGIYIYIYIYTKIILRNGMWHRYTLALIMISIIRLGFTYLGSQIWKIIKHAHRNPQGHPTSTQKWWKLLMVNPLVKFKIIKFIPNIMKDKWTNWFIRFSALIYSCLLRLHIQKSRFMSPTFCS